MSKRGSRNSANKRRQGDDQSGYATYQALELLKLTQQQSKPPYRLVGWFLVGESVDDARIIKSAAMHDDLFGVYREFRSTGLNDRYSVMVEAEYNPVKPDEGSVLMLDTQLVEKALALSTASGDVAPYFKRLVWVLEDGRMRYAMKREREPEVYNDYEANQFFGDSRHFGAVLPLTSRDAQPIRITGCLFQPAWQSIVEEWMPVEREALIPNPDELGEAGLSRIRDSLGHYVSIPRTEGEQ
jgi:hypothetical protein